MKSQYSEAERKRHTRVRRSVWLGALAPWLTRTRASGKESTALRRRRFLLMMAGLLLIAMGGLWWGIYAWLQHLPGLVGMSLLMLSGVAVRQLTVRDRRGAAAAVLFGSCTLLLTLVCLFLDLPSGDVPRSTHLYFLSLAAVTPMLLHDEHDTICWLFMGLMITIFLFFAATEFGIHTPYALPPPVQRACAWINSSGAVFTLMLGIVIGQAQPLAGGELLGELRGAVRRGEFELFLQPIVDPQGRPLGAEALIRWLHPKRGLIEPGTFIALAESSGLIVPIGQWAIEECCRLLARWQRQPRLCGLTLAANVSALQLRQPGFAPAVLQALRESGAPAPLLLLELTESTVVSDLEQAQRVMGELGLAGVRFALDDFGTGHSSLNHLLQLPVARLKIDQTFVRAMHLSPRALSIVEALLALGHSLDRPVVAEGVETRAQLAQLCALGCRQFQGYLFSPAVPVEDFERLVKAQPQAVEAAALG